MMKSTLTLHGRQLASIFELLGEKENDFTYSIGWALSRCPTFLKAFLAGVFPNTPLPDAVDVCLQEHGTEKGFTDIELQGEGLHVIVEAKRGWQLPSRHQLAKYRPRIHKGTPLAAIVAVSECTREYAEEFMDAKVIDGVPVMHRSWADLTRCAAGGESHAEKRLLGELCTYIRRYANMQKQDSNWVYVVSLSNDDAGGGGLSYIDIVVKKHKYFHPYGGKGGWPKMPPNYMGFRYYGKLQSIHHIEGHRVFRNFHDVFPEFPDRNEDGPLVVYDLGPAIVPSKPVASGRVKRAMRVWAMLDTLLTSATISDARDESAKRGQESPS